MRCGNGSAPIDPQSGFNNLSNIPDSQLMQLCQQAQTHIISDQLTTQLTIRLPAQQPSVAVYEFQNVIYHRLGYDASRR